MSLEYSYITTAGNTSYVDDNDFVLVGTWSASTPYTVMQAVTYGNSKYLCLVNNTGQTPSITSAYWSPLVLLYRANGTQPTAMEVATSGSNLAWNAYNLAINGLTPNATAKVENGIFYIWDIGVNQYVPVVLNNGQLATP